jgi:hypothetical protein
MRQPWILQHPSTTPDPGQWRWPGLLIEPPGRWSSTRSWQEFGDELACLLRAYPGDPNLPLYIAAADTVIAWRATVPAEDRFWADDRD